MLSILTSLLSWAQSLPTLPRHVRMLMVAMMHLTLFAAAFICAYLVRFDFNVPDVWLKVMWTTLPVILGCKLLVFGALRMYQGWWKYISLYDVVALFRALVIASTVFMLGNIFTQFVTLPRSIYVLDFGLTLVLVGGARGSLRLLREAFITRVGPEQKLENTLIIGAGDTGETLIREINKNAHLPFKVIGFLDDDQHKQGLRIHNVSVLGQLADLEELVKKHNITTVIIAMPSASREQLRRAINLSKSLGLTTKILPAVESIIEGGLSLKQLREVSISDLLGRDAVRLDMQSIGRFLQGRVVMVTGAGGSIGSEICRQVLRFEPEALIMVERAETPLFFIERELIAQHSQSKLIPYIASIADADRMREIFLNHRPHVVLHAAAYKHVPLMEGNPSEAVKNNVVGTQVIADVAVEAGVETFVLISTDKAVNPTSVMGATKRVTELYIMEKHREQKTTRFCAVRFGNVLGSNGSVVPIFREQLRQGGPITVTHPEMTRYFMTIPEATQLVLQAGSLGEGGEIFILDMGEPVKIADLAKDMIRLSGLSEDEVEIKYTGVRPGEKLFEELAIDEDNMDRTRHDKIFVASKETQGLEQLSEQYRGLLQAARDGNDLEVRRTLKRLIPTYKFHDLPENVVPFDSGSHKKVSRQP